MAAGAYITANEFIASPTAVDWRNLVPGGDSAAQLAALTLEIARASAWCDNQVNQPLVASTHVVMTKVTAGASGEVIIHPDHGPANQLLSLSLGYDVPSLATVDTSGAYIYNKSFVVPVTSVSGRLLAKIQYVSGWAQTTLTQATLAGATTLRVASGLGFAPTLGAELDNQITIYDGANTETVTVTAINGTTLTVSACTFAHASGAAVSNMPDDLKRAAVLATVGFIRMRSTQAVVMTNQTSPGVPQAADPMVQSSLKAAIGILYNYERTL